MSVMVRRNRYDVTLGMTGAAVVLPGPDSISGLYLWLKADAGTFQDAGITPATADGNPIGRWADQSGNGRHFNQTTSGSKPSLQTGEINGLPVIQFDGSDDSLVGPDFSALTAGEIFIVLRRTVDPAASNATSGFWDFGAVIVDSHVPWVDGIIYDAWGSTERKSTGDPATSLTSPALYSVISTSSEWTNFINGTQHFTTGTNTVGFETVTILGESLTLSTFYDGVFAEVIVYSAKLSSGDRTTVKTYIASRYGISIS